MANDEISDVGAAFSRDYAMNAIKRFFFAAGSRSHEKMTLTLDLSKFHMRVAAGLKNGQFNRRRNSKKENVEGMNSVFLNRQSTAKPSFNILRFDIRYSAVRCFVRVKFHAGLQVSGFSDSPS